MNILLIGSSGYIGSRLTEYFSPKYNITKIDIGWFTNKNIDIEIDYNKLDKKFYKKFDIVILLAGHSSVKMCEGNMKSSFNNNVINFINLLEKLNSNQKFIYASSSSVYGNTGSSIVDEQYFSFVPHNHYDITKHIIDLYSSRFDVNTYGLRFGTVNGYSPIVRKDVMINSMVYDAIVNKQIKLYIKDIKRPILGISDLCRAIDTIILDSNNNTGIYNLASFTSTAEDIAKSVSNITKIPIVEYETCPTQITNSKLQTKCYDFSINSDKFKNTFSFEFKETIQTIVKELIDNFDKIEFTSRHEFKHYE